MRNLVSMFLNSGSVFVHCPDCGEKIEVIKPENGRARINYKQCTHLIVTLNDEVVYIDQLKYRDWGFEDQKGGD